MNNILIIHTFYLLCTIALTMWVAHTLFKNGQVFLIDIFHGNTELAQADNNLLWVGFYLVNIGYALYALKTTAVVVDAHAVIEILSLKLGSIILILDCMHFFNMFLFFKLRKRAIGDKLNLTGYDYRIDPENIAGR